MAKSRLEEFYTTKEHESVGWALVFFLGALVILAEMIGYSEIFAWWNGWSLFFAGVGVIMLSGTPFLFHFGKHEKAKGNLIFGLITLGIGLDGLVNFGWIWIIIFTSIGFAILLSTFTKVKK